MRKPFTTAELNEARRMRDDGCTYRQIGESLGRPHQTIRYHLDSEHRESAKRRERERHQQDESHRKRGNERSRKWHAENRERVREHSKREWREKKDDPNYRARSTIAKSKYEARKAGYAPVDVDLEVLEAAFADPKCYLCGVPECECKKRLHVEHDHETGEFRGLACNRCNVLIGFLETCPDLIEKFNNLFPKEQDITKC